VEIKEEQEKRRYWWVKEEKQKESDRGEAVTMNHTSGSDGWDYEDKKRIFTYVVPTLSDRTNILKNLFRTLGPPDPHTLPKSTV